LNLAMDKDFSQYTSLYLAHLIGLSCDSDFNIRKMSIDTIYTFAKMHPQTLKPFKKDITDVLTDLKFDKMKLVREATNEALTALKDVPDSVILS
jgi:hypothetical protein